MFRRTKIVATLGPASSSTEMLRELIAAGVNVFRLNFSHGTADDHLRVAKAIRSCADKLECSVAILADLQGPKIRIGCFTGGAVALQAGDRFTLDYRHPERGGDATRVGTSYQGLPGDCAPGDTLLLDDGRICLGVDSVEDSAVHCTVLTGGELSDHKGVNKQGGGLSAPALTDKDREDIVSAARMDADYLAVSFPRNADDMQEARRLWQEAGGQGGLVAKVERAEAVADHEGLDALIAASDGVMVARGDLAVEIGDAELVGVQKHIIQRARALDRFVITATQMMESMIHSPQPTRAEVSDVANAVLDGTDAVMLSAETAVGQYPVATVQAMDRIILGAERTYQTRPGNWPDQGGYEHINTAIARAAMYVGNRLQGLKAIIALTDSGNTPRLMSRVRSGIPIFAFTAHARTRRRVATYRGVSPIAFDPAAHTPEEANRRAVALLREKGLVTDGDRIIITRGDADAVHGGTDAMKIIEV